MKSKEEMLDKVKKLLALADSNRNDSDEEAKSALLMAQKLMAKYDISVEEVEEPEEQQYAYEACEHKWDYAFRIPLAHILAKNFRCMTYMRGKQIVFMGHASDAKVCRSTFEFAYNYIQRRGNSVYNKRYSMGLKTKGVFNSYANGFLCGLKQAFDVQCVALAIVTSPDVVDKFNEMTEGWKTTKGKRIESQDAEAWREGNKDGKSFMDKNKLEA